MSDDELQAFWRRFIASPMARSIENPKLYGAMRVGSTPEDADLGASLTLEGRKTATSSHPSEYDEFPGQPFVGALSVVLDGSHQPVAVVETVEMEMRELSDLDDSFASDYGEWDQTADTLKSKLEAYYRARLSHEVSDVTCELQLLCERFRVVYSEQ